MVLAAVSQFGNGDKPVPVPLNDYLPSPLVSKMDIKPTFKSEW